MHPMNSTTQYLCTVPSIRDSRAWPQFVMLLSYFSLTPNPTRHPKFLFNDIYQAAVLFVSLILSIHWITRFLHRGWTGERNAEMLTKKLKTSKIHVLPRLWDLDRAWNRPMESSSVRFERKSHVRVKLFRIHSITYNLNTYWDGNTNDMFQYSKPTSSRQSHKNRLYHEDKLE